MSRHGHLVASGLLKYRIVFGPEGDLELRGVAYFARGIGWTSKEVAQSSWTADEIRRVNAAEIKIMAEVRS